MVDGMHPDRSLSDDVRIERDFLSRLVSLSEHESPIGLVEEALALVAERAGATKAYLEIREPGSIRPQRDDRVIGRITVHPAGYGFVATEAGETVFVPAKYRNTSLDGDRVAVDTWPGVRGTEGRVIEVLARGRARLTGILRRVGRAVYEPALLVEHMHPSFGKGEWDRNHEERLARAREAGLPALWDELEPERAAEAERLLAAIEGG